MTKPFIILFLYLISLSALSIGQINPADTSYLKFCVETLASDSMGGRKPGTIYDLKAANFIAEQFKSCKIKPFQKNIYFQNFNYTYDSSLYKTRNVIAVINNKATENIIIGAHYDHIGLGGKRSRSYGKHEIHNGADDNASGVALMLGLARQLKKQKSKKYNFIFVAFSGHEDGLFGSRYFTESNIVDFSSVKLMINLDMLGRADNITPSLFIASNDSLTLANSLNLTASTLKIKAKELPPGDHSAFEAYHIPVLYFTTGMHDDYHKTSDDAKYINYKSMSYIEEFIFYILNSF
jgi:Zn-dependent M28 family amino/carboxypeptidase